MTYLKTDFFISVNKKRCLIFPLFSEENHPLSSFLNSCWTLIYKNFTKNLQVVKFQLIKVNSTLPSKKI